MNLMNCISPEQAIKWTINHKGRAQFDLSDSEDCWIEDKETICPET